MYTEEHFTTRGFRERIHLLHPAKRFVHIHVKMSNEFKVHEFDAVELILGRHKDLGRDELMVGKRSIFQDLPFGTQIVVLYECAS